MSARTTPKPPFWTSTSKPPAKRLRGTLAQLLEHAEDGEDGARVLPYDRAQRYDLGALILHGAFGLGVVVEVPSTGKMTVRFEGGDKLLVAGG